MNGRPHLDLTDQHLQFLHDRAVADDVAEERGYQSSSCKAELDRLEFPRSQQLHPSLIIPIWSVRAAIENYQLRPDKPRLNKKGKPSKYETRQGSRMLIDAHPRLTRIVEGQKIALIANPGIPLWITEGIPKADSAISIGLACLGLLGVSNFRGTNTAGGITALADWESIALNQRDVCIVFDSDVMQKQPVATALARLKTLLESRRANVKLIYLPPGENAQKTGLDDFIAREKAAHQTDAAIRQKLLELATSELRRPLKPQTDRPEIVLTPGQMPQIVDEAEKVLAINAKRLGIFQRGGQIVQVSRTDRETEDRSAWRPCGNLQLKSLSSVALTEYLDRHIQWVRNNGEEYKVVDCPPKVAATYLARNNWALLHLRGVIEAPLLRPDGTILNSLGYDENTGLFLQGDSDWSPIADHPSRDDAQSALSYLLNPFDDFPFVGEASKSVLAAAILTALQRRVLDSAPIFGFSAPAQRTGKSLLAEAVGIIASGRKPAAMGVTAQDDELRKAITAMLREGQGVVNLDNIVHPLDSAHLARAITQSIYADRILGESQTVSLPTNVLWLATGNNLSFKGELTSRALVCRIDAEVERPEARQFKISDLTGHLISNRKLLVAAGLTILRAYHIAGRPKQELSNWGGFSQWSCDIRAPLVWLGCADPCDTREQIIENDPNRDAALAVFEFWHAEFGEHEVTVAELVAKSSAGLNAALLNIASEGRNNPTAISSRRLGNWCRMNQDRICGNYRLTRAGSHRHAIKWRVSYVSPVSLKSASENSRAKKATENVVPSATAGWPERNSPELTNSHDQGDGIEL